MPQFDQTGPEGQGAMTGRRQGRCTNFEKEKGSRSGEDNTTSTPPGQRRMKGRTGRGKGMGMQNRVRGER